MKWLLVLMLLLNGFLVQGQVKTKQVTEDGFMLVSAPVIEKEYHTKNGTPSGRTELYLRLSMQDFFIKLCESKVTAKQLEEYIEDGLENFRVGKFKIEIRDGAWDQCGENESASRVGKYVAILGIEE